MMLACLPLSFLSLVCLCMLEFLMLALYVPYNMIIYPCVTICFAPFVSACFVLPRVIPLLLFASLFTCSCMCLCVLVVSSSVVPTHDLVQVHTLLCTRDPESLLETLLDGTGVVCAPI